MKAHTIFGPPGTGKTTELIRIADDRCKDRRGLMLSYTKAAAQELVKRTNNDNLRASTLHSAAFGRLNLGRNAVVDNMKLVEFGAKTGITFKASGDFQEGEQEGDEYLAVHSYARNRIMSDSDAYDHFGRPGTPARFQMCIQAYADWKQTFGYMDFDDMLTQASKVKFPDMPVVCLDESQDCSPLQWAVFEQICKGAKEVYIAGDDDQAIYEWSGADPHGMRTFTERYDARQKTLALSHRVPQRVGEVADRLIKEVVERVPKEFAWADRRGTVVSRGEFELAVPVKEDWQTLILTRDNYRLRELQQELNDDRVPYALSTSNGPYENRYAKALRAYHRKDLPEDDEREAAALVGTAAGSKFATDRNWDAYRAMPWNKVINIKSHRQREFYADLDPKLLFTPLRIRLSTIHQAKGSESDLVILDCTMTSKTEMAIDHDRDAELRVWYVGLTRARHELRICGENPLL